MGLLSLGTPLSWDDTKKAVDHVRNHGITQFLNTWDRVKDKNGDELRWGDEVEYMVVSLDEKTKNAKLSLRQSEILAKLDSIVKVVNSICPKDSYVSLPEHPTY
jgi:glutamate--cysteine ligase catalytic subunit